MTATALQALQPVLGNLRERFPGVAGDVGGHRGEV